MAELKHSRESRMKGKEKKESPQPKAEYLGSGAASKAAKVLGPAARRARMKNLGL